MIKIEIVEASKIKEYEKNAKRHPRKQIEQIKKSIQEFGFNDPIAVDENNVIIEGHGRFKALQELGYTDIECIRLTHLTEEQKKAYILAHNKLNMETGFDTELLLEEIDSIEEIDMSDFGFDMDNILKDMFSENERQRTNDKYNLDDVNVDNCTGFYQMPIIKREDFIPTDLIGFNYAKTSKVKNTGIHFYIDDYQFERVWNKPSEYIEILRKYECILSPDFSLYMDMPMAMKIWNIYRSRFIGQYYQSKGIKVIPTVSWGEAATFDFCFEGIEKGGTVSISTIGIKQNPEAMKIWRDGVDELIKRIRPSTILVYGGKVDYDFKDIKVVYFANKVTERMTKNKEVKTDDT